MNDFNTIYSNCLFVHKGMRNKKVKNSWTWWIVQHVLDAISSELIRKQSRKWQIKDIKCRCKRRFFYFIFRRSLLALNSCVCVCVCVFRWFAWFLLRPTVLPVSLPLLPLCLPMQIEEFIVSFVYSVVCMDRKYFLDLANNANSICIDCCCVRHKIGHEETRWKIIVESK